MKPTSFEEPNFQLNFEPVLADEYTRSLELVQVYVADIELRDSSQFSKLCSLKFKKNQLDHLKRFRKKRKDLDEETYVNTGIICLVEEKSLQELEKIFQSQNWQTKVQVYTIDVPKFPPLTKLQFEAWNSVWPVFFFQSTTLYEKFSIKELEFFEEGLDKVQRLVEDPSFVQDEECNPITLIYNQQLQLVAQETFQSSTYSLNHTILNSIQKVAEREVQSRQVKRNLDKLKPSEELNYLCVDTTIFLAKEPCVMCAMALVHSRVRRVLYLNSQPSGALGTKWKIHCHPNLNHNFYVYKRK